MTKTQSVQNFSPFGKWQWHLKRARRIGSTAYSNKSYHKEPLPLPFPGPSQLNHNSCNNFNPTNDIYLVCKPTSIKKIFIVIIIIHSKLCYIVSFSITAYGILTQELYCTQWLFNTKCIKSHGLVNIALSLAPWLWNSFWTVEEWSVLA